MLNCSADFGRRWFALGHSPTKSEILQFHTSRQWLYRQFFFLDNSQCCATLLQNESTKAHFLRKSVVGCRDWLAENLKLSCFRIYIKRSGSKNRYHVFAVLGKLLSAQAQRAHAQQRGSI